MISLRYVEGDGKVVDITHVTGSYSRSDNVDSLGMEFSFSLVSNPLDENYKNYAIPIGTKVIFSNNGVNLFTGIVVKYSRNGLTSYNYTCFDYGFYLNKSEAFIQFNNVSVSTALERLCKENEIPVGSIADISTSVKKLYNGDKLSDIIKDLLKKATDEKGTKYRLEMRENKLYIEPYEKLVINARYKPARNIADFDVTKMVGSFSSEYSMEDMKTRVMVVSSSEKNAQVFGNVQDSNNIERYGLLTKVEKIENKKKSQAVNIAQKKLKELNKIKESFKVTVFGDDTVRAGRILVFNQEDINLKGNYLVKNCTHTYNGRMHLMELDLKLEE